MQCRGNVTRKAMKEGKEGLGRCGCGKDLSLHSREGFKACALRFGGEITEDGVGYVVLENVGTDGVASRAEFMASEYSICNRILGQHSDAELEDCLRVMREKKS